MENVDDVEYVYSAFVSHSHRDAKWAEWVWKALEHYRLPSNVRKRSQRPLPKRIRAFLDTADLGVDNLDEGLYKELKASRFLVVLCSPESAKPNALGTHYVETEVRRFEELGRAKQIIPVIISGTVETAFCPALRRLNIKAVDATQLSRPRALNDIVAKILGLRPDELWDRWRRQQRIKLVIRSIFGAAAVLALAVAGLFVWERERTVILNYADVIDDFGVPRGIFTLSDGEVAHRQNHYRFEYRGLTFGPWIHADAEHRSPFRILGAKRILRRVSLLGASGRPYRGAWPVDEGEPEIRDIHYDMSEGRADRIRCGRYAGEGAASKLIRQELLSSERGVINGLVQYRGAADSILVHTAGTKDADDGTEGKNEIVQFRIGRDAHGRKTSEMYLNAYGDQTPDGHGVWGKRYGLDGCGRPVEVTSLDVAGVPCADRVGVSAVRCKFDGPCLTEQSFCDLKGDCIRSVQGHAKYLISYDSHGNAIESRGCGADDRPSLDKTGQCGRRVERDDAGRITRTTYLGLDGNPIVTSDGTAMTTFVFDRFGQCVSHRYFDAKGNPTLHKQAGNAGGVADYNGQGQIVRTSSVGTDGKLMRCAAGFAEKTMAYDPDGNECEVRYFDERGRQVVSDTGVFGLRRKYNEQGNLIREVGLSSDGRPMCCKFGFAEEVYVYDRRGNRRERRLLGVDGRPTVGDRGFHRVVWEYDDRGLMTDETVFGTDQRPVYGPKGYATVKCKYDGRGRLEEEWYLDVNGQPMYNKAGCAKVRMTYFESGKVRTKEFLGLDGRPAVDIHEGMAKIAFAYDERGNLTGTSFYGTDGSLMTTPAGNAGWMAQYDAHGNMTNCISLGCTGRPIVAKDGYARIACRYDERGNCLEKSFFGVNGELSGGPDGIARVCREFDANDHVVKESNYGADGALIYSKDGYATLSQQYDSHGNLILVVRLGAQGEPVSGADGAACMRYQYDDASRVVKVSIFDEQGLPVENKEGIAEKRIEYDAHGHESAYVFYDRNGSETYCSGGYSRQEFERDHAGRLLMMRHRGLERQLVRTVDGYAEVHYEYDGQGREIERYYIGPDGAPCIGKEGVARYSSRYDHLGRPVSVRAIGLDGMPCRGVSSDGTDYSIPEIRYEYDDRGNRAFERYYGATGGRFLYQGAYYGVHKEYDVYGRDVRWTYLDQNDGPAEMSYAVTCEKNYAIVEYARDIRGNVTNCCYRSKTGALVDARDDGCVAMMNFEFDVQGRKVRQWNFDSNRKLTVGKGCGAEISFEYDNRGRLLREFRRGTDRQPLSINEGVAETIVKYDDMGNRTEERYTDGRGHAIFNNDGYCGYRARFGQLGKCMEFVRLGADGAPTCGKDGVAMIRRQYDRMGRLVEETYCDTNGTMTVADGGQSGMRYEYDRVGNELSRYFLGQDLKVLGRPGEASYSKFEYDAQGRLVACDFLDSDGNPAPSKGKLTRKMWSYWGGSRVVRQSEFICGLPRPMLYNKPDLYRSVHSYDPAGKLISQNWYAADGVPIATTNVAVFMETEVNGQARALGFQLHDVCCRWGAYSVANSEDWCAVVDAIERQRKGTGDNLILLARKVDDKYRVLEMRPKSGMLGARVADEIISVREYREILTAFQEYVRNHSLETDSKGN